MPIANCEATSQITMTIADIATIMKKSHKTIRRWDREGLLPARGQASKSIVFKTADVLLWLDLGCPDRQAFEALKRTKQQLINA